jgi:hypothetical protein
MEQNGAGWSRMEQDADPTSFSAEYKPSCFHISNVYLRLVNAGSAAENLNQCNLYCMKIGDLNSILWSC